MSSRSVDEQILLRKKCIERNHHAGCDNQDNGASNHDGVDILVNAMIDIQSTPGIFLDQIASVDKLDTFSEFMHVVVNEPRTTNAT